MKKTNIIFVLVICVLAIGGGSFYAGMEYGKNIKSLNRFDMSKEGFNQMGAANVGGQRGMRNGEGLAVGEIISKDDKSMTIKLRDGGSKIIFFTDNTSISKNAEGFLEDLKTGEQITVSGSSNQDGSVNAQSIQIKPSMSEQIKE